MGNDISNMLLSKGARSQATSNIRRRLLATVPRGIRGRSIQGIMTRYWKRIHVSFCNSGIFKRRCVGGGTLKIPMTDVFHEEVAVDSVIGYFRPYFTGWS